MRHAFVPTFTQNKEIKLKIGLKITPLLSPIPPTRPPPWLFISVPSVREVMREGEMEHRRLDWGDEGT